MSNNSGFDRLGWFLFGLGVGAVLGILFAPEKGEVTRQKLKEKIRELAKKLKSYKEKVNQVNTESNSHEIYDSSKGLKEDEREKADELMGEIMSLFSEIKHLKEREEK
jgi:gas vesicle protein